VRRALPALLALAVAQAATAQRFLPDDPLLFDRDDLPIAKPGVVELSTAWDVIEHSLWHRPSGRVPPALNANTLGEVPDSSWFQNRIGRREMSLEELLRGPNTTGGPAPGRWMVIGGKAQGITAGFTIRDSRGDVYFVKFDPIPYPNLSSAADVIVTKFFHAFGYFVPENHIAQFRPEQLVIAEDARVRDRGHKEPRMMTQADVDGILARAPRRPDGSIRCLASRRLPGEPIGPHKYWGTRGDDPNDAFPHEHRRELRGYRVFSAWLNHDDSRSVNSLDIFLAGEDGRGWVKHHLIDFSSSLGSGSDAMRQIAPQNPRAGNEYVLERAPFLKTAVSLGLWERPWRRVRYEVFPEVGRIEADFFEPDAWRPEYPSPAFERMLPADAFWAARIVSRFSDEAVRALVHSGEFDDPAAERHLADSLIRRRDKIVARYFRALNPLAEFRVEGSGSQPALVFDNLGERAGLGRGEAYEYEWFVLENRTGRLDPLPARGEVREARVELPGGSHSYVMVRLRTRSQEPAWRKAVDVYVRREGTASVVGIEREE
jgi:hypothetical protein